METGIDLIKKEREDQILKHGKTTDYDIEFNEGCQLSIAAAVICMPQVNFRYEPPTDWDIHTWNRMVSKSYRERLIIAGALIAAEIDRLTAIGEI